MVRSNGREIHSIVQLGDGGEVMYISGQMLTVEEQGVQMNKSVLK